MTGCLCHNQNLCAGKGPKACVRTASRLTSSVTGLGGGGSVDLSSFLAWALWAPRVDLAFFPIFVWVFWWWLIGTSQEGRLTINNLFVCSVQR